jgi:hypothetical protein
MPETEAPGSTFVRSGAIAGVLSAFVFVVIHDIFISNIWFSLVVMLIAGAACGMSVGWAYGAMVPDRSVRSWASFNAAFVLMFFALGLASVLVFEPRTTIAVLIEENEPPGDLIAAALPMTAVFTIGAAVVMAWIFGRGWSSLGPALVTSVVLVVLLGLNVSVIGLVDIPTDSAYLVGELFALIVALDVVMAAVFWILERRALAGDR